MSLRAAVHLRRGDLHLDVDLSVAAGTVATVVGPNGAGKTTLLRALAGLQRLESGCIAVAGQTWEDPGRGIRLPPERRRVGFVFQDYQLFPHLSVLENVAFGLRARGVRKATSAATEWLERIDLREYAQARPEGLSGGQAQRVALARALAADPSLLLLDEPLSALDQAARDQMRGALRAHLRSYAGCVLLVTHDPQDAALADAVLTLERGRLLAPRYPLAAAEARTAAPAGT